MNPSIERLREALAYDPETGAMTWRVRPRDHFLSDRVWRLTNSRYAGKVAGTTASSEYRAIVLRLDGVKHRIGVHRAAFALMTGAWPDAEIDHRNGDRVGNYWSNLRAATQAENHHNNRLYRSNTSGFMGVSWHRSTGKWRADIQAHGRPRFCGLYVTREEAYAAYLAAKSELHPFQPVPR